MIGIMMDAYTKAVRVYLWMFWLVFIVGCTDQVERTLEMKELSYDLQVDTYTDSLFVGKILGGDEHNGLLYWADYTHSQVMVMDTDLRFKLRMGYKGEDAEGMLGTQQVFVNKNGVFVMDDSQVKILEFDHSGSFRNSSRLKNRVFYGTSRFFIDDLERVFFSAVDTEHPISVYNKDLTSYSDIGSFKEDIGKMSQIKTLIPYNKHYFIAIDDGYPATVQMYTTNGELLGEGPIPGAENIQKHRLKYIEETTKGKVAPGVSFRMVEDAVVQDGKVYILIVNNAVTGEPYVNEVLEATVESGDFELLNSYRLTGCTWATTLLVTKGHIFAFDAGSNSIFRYPR